MVFDYKIVPVRNEAVDSASEIHGFLRHRKTVTRKQKKNRRKSIHDRRESIRDGVIVSLSFQNNRRKNRDRRNVSGERRQFGSGDIVVL